MLGEQLQFFTGELLLVAAVGEAVAPRVCLLHVADSAVDVVAALCLGDHAALHILLEAGEGHERGERILHARLCRDLPSFVRARAPGVAIVVARADGDDFELVESRLPAKVILGQCRHAVGEMSGIIIPSHTAIDEVEVAAIGGLAVFADFGLAVFVWKPDSLGWEIVWGCGTGADDLPDGDLQIAVVARGIVVRGVGVIGLYPVGEGIGTHHDDHQVAVEFARAHGAIWEWLAWLPLWCRAKDSLQFFAQLVGLEDVV